MTGDPYRNVMVAVVEQAFRDATNDGRTKAARMDRRNARDWLLDGGKDFSDVCSMAGFEPSVVRQSAQRALDQGWPAIRELAA